VSNTAEKMSDDTLFASVFRVSACSALVTYLLLCGLNSDVFLSLSFLKIVGVSILLLLFPGGIYCFTQHPVRTIAALFLFLLVVGTLDSDVLDACLVLLLTVVAGRDLISTKFWHWLLNANVCRGCNECATRVLKVPVINRSSLTHRRKLRISL